MSRVIKINAAGSWIRAGAARVLVPDALMQTTKNYLSSAYTHSTTEHPENVCTWLREVSSCSCLTVLPGPAWVLLSKTYKPLFPPLYSRILLPTKPQILAENNISSLSSSSARRTCLASWFGTIQRANTQIMHLWWWHAACHVCALDGRTARNSANTPPTPALVYTWVVRCG